MRIVEERMGEVLVLVKSLSEQLETLTQAVLELQSAGELSSGLPDDLPTRLPILYAIALVQAQTSSDSLVNHSELPTTALSEALEPKADESLSNLHGDLLADREGYVGRTDELPDELGSEPLEQAWPTARQGILEPLVGELPNLFQRIPPVLSAGLRCGLQAPIQNAVTPKAEGGSYVVNQVMGMRQLLNRISTLLEQ